MKPHRKKVQVWIYRRKSNQTQPEFLLLLTKPDRGGFWQPVTGSVEEDETLSEAALREAGEESGLSFSVRPEPLGADFEYESRGERVIESGFSLEAPQGSEKCVLDPHEHTQYRWVKSDEAFKLLAYPSNAQILEILIHKITDSLKS